MCKLLYLQLYKTVYRFQLSFLVLVQIGFKVASTKMGHPVLGISETRYEDEGTIRLDGYTFIYSGGDEHQHGVGFLMKSALEKSILGYWPVSHRNNSDLSSTN